MPGPLAGLSVIELGDGVASAFCGRLLAGFGASVFVIEPPGGHPLRHARVVPGAPPPKLDEAPAFLYLGMGKRSLALSLDDPRALEFAWRLCAAADAVVTDRHPVELEAQGLTHDSLTAANPRLVFTSLRPFGDSGPYRDWEAANITAFGMGGQMALTGEPDREPLCTAGDQAWYQQGIHGFAATTLALLGAARTGLGQRVEVSAIEAMAGALEGFGPSARALGMPTPRTGRARFSLMGIYPCADGYAGIYGTYRALPAIARLMGREDIAADTSFDSLPSLIRRNDELTDMVAGYLRGLTRQQVREIGRATSTTMAPVEGVAEVAANPHLAARGFFDDLPGPGGRTLRLPGRPFRMLATPWQSRPAPAPGECPPAEALATVRASAAAFRPPTLPDRSPARAMPRDRMADGLLAGVRVLDFTAYWAGPYCTKWLADFGAEVIKVESPGLMDFVRTISSDYTHERPYDMSAYFNNYNRGKRSLAVDPVHPQGRALLLDLVRHADVVVENFKAGRMRAMGLGYEELAAARPGLVMLSISGYGQDGPDATLPGVGTNMEQLSGICSLNRYDDSPQPYNTGIAYGDPTSGTLGAAAIAMALRHRDCTGEGQYIELAGHEVLVSLIGEQFAAHALGLVPAPTGNRHPGMAPHGCYPCAGDDQWLTIAVRSDDEWAALCRAIGREDLAAAHPDLDARQAAAHEIDAAITGWTVTLDRYEAALRLQSEGIAAGPVLTTLDLAHDPHLRQRGYYVTVSHPDQGPWPIDGIAWRLSRTPGIVRAPAPRFGEHTREVLRDIGGLDPAAIEEIFASGAASDVPAR
jgi:crotonobetainyl-CoA:carnitine CoA-transferase CaiB-like acyl-CoA transferase